MESCKILILLLCLGLASACGKLPSRYNELNLVCGELDVESLSSGGSALQIFSHNKALASSNVQALWVTPSQSKNLSVSSKSCVVAPKGEGLLKITSGDRNEGYLSSPNTEGKGIVTPVYLRPIEAPKFKIVCSKNLVSSPADLDVSLLWESLQLEDAWQFESLHVTISQQDKTIVNLPIVKTSELFLNKKLSLAALRLQDGFYSLNLQIKTINEKLVVAESACPFQLDQTPPLAPHMLRDTISNGQGPLRLTLDKGIHQIYYCIDSKAQSTCGNPQSFVPATEYIAAPESGSFVLYSYAEDEAGNRSVITQEPFFRDQSSPSINFQWTQENLRQSYNWALKLADHYTFTVTAQDDSVQNGFLSEKNLTQSIECRVATVDQAGSERQSTGAVCRSGQCQGLSLDTFVPCSGSTEFSFDPLSEYNLVGNLIKVYVRATDAVQKQGQTVSSFWMNADGIGQWKAENDVRFRNLNSYLSFANDRSGRFWSLATTINRDNTSLTLRAKEPESDTWSTPITLQVPVSSDGQSWALSSSQEPLITESFDNPKSESMWFSSGPRYVKDGQLDVLAEVKLNNQIPFAVPKTMTPVFHTIPKSLMDQLIVPEGTELSDSFSIQALDRLNSGKIAVLATWSTYEDREFAIFTFDGNNFELLGQRQTLHIDPKFQEESATFGIESLIHQGPQNTLVLVINGRIGLFDPLHHRVIAASISPEPQEKIRLLNSDQVVLQRLAKETATRIKIPFANTSQNANLRARAGFYGLLQGKLRPFTLNFSDHDLSATMNVLETSNSHPAVSSVYSMVRRGDGSFWIDGHDVRSRHVIMNVNPDDKIWKLEDSQWGWAATDTFSGSVYYGGLGLDLYSDQVYVLTTSNTEGSRGATELVLRKSISKTFIDVTDQSAFRSDWRENPSSLVFLGQDSKGNLWQASYLTKSHLLLASLDEPGQAKRMLSSKNISSWSWNESSPTNYIGLDGSGSYWYTEPTGETFRYQPDKNDFFREFDTQSYWNFTHFDDQGKYWGISREDRPEVRVVRADRTIHSLTLPDQQLASKIFWNSQQAWLQSTQADDGTFQLFLIDQQHESLKADIQLPNAKASFADMIVFRGKRLALVYEQFKLDALQNVVTPIKIFEETDDGWKAWKETLQPQFPSWHFQTRFGEHKELSGTGLAKIFYDKGRETLWISTEPEQGAPILASFSLQEKLWTYYNPRVENIQTPVRNFFLDRQGQLVLQTNEKIFRLNPYAQK